MDAITFSLEELSRLDILQLKILAKYYKLSARGKKETLVKRLDKYYRPISEIPLSNEDLGKKLLPDETAENPRYSARIRRIYWLSKMKENKI